MKEIVKGHIWSIGGCRGGRWSGRRKSEKEYFRRRRGRMRGRMAR